MTSAITAGIHVAAPGPGTLGGVLAGQGDVSSPGRGEPGHHARANLLELPLLSLLHPMMCATQRGEITLARPAALVMRDRMIEVARYGGGGGAAGRGRGGRRGRAPGRARPGR